MILQLNPTIDVRTPLGDCEALFLIDYGVNVNTVWVCRMSGGEVKHFYSDDIRIYDNPMNGKGWDVETKNYPEFEGPIERFPKVKDQFKVESVEGMPDDVVLIDPPGKWTLPPDHPDNGGALIGQDKEKWENIYISWSQNEKEPHFIEYLDEYYEPPLRFNLSTWEKVYNWRKSLADYRDVSFLDFLIKFYPAPDLKR